MIRLFAKLASFARVVPAFLLGAVLALGSAGVAHVLIVRNVEAQTRVEVTHEINTSLRERETRLRLQIRELETDRRDALAEIETRFAAAQNVFEQELARHELDRFFEGRSCALTPADLDRLRSLWDTPAR
jgi:hypothetical protein